MWGVGGVVDVGGDVKMALKVVLKPSVRRENSIGEGSRFFYCRLIGSNPPGNTAPTSLSLSLTSLCVAGIYKYK